VSAHVVDNHAFGVRLLELRVARQWTPRELAERARVGRGVVGAVEDGQGCTVLAARGLAMALDVPLEQLLGPVEARDVA
jgi:transcriptional regulator with XRE-family HTH domain